MKSLLKKRIVILLSMLCVLLTIITLSACTAKQKEQAVKAYGQSKAYNKTDSNIDITVERGSINYYIPTTVKGDYKTISEYAIAKANTLTSTVNVGTSTSTKSNYKYAIVSSSTTHPNANAYNSYSYNVNGEINKSTITYVTGKLDGESMDYKKHTALHEMGHTFGLGHIEADEMRGYTVMISPHPSKKKYQTTDYTEFDKYNITWKYGS